MEMMYVLIAVMMPVHGSSALSQEFNSLENCERALIRITESVPFIQYIDCVPK